MEEIKKLNSNVEFLGIGGVNMSRQGLKSIVDIKDISVVGFSAIAKKYLFFRELLKKCKEILINENIDLFLPLDYPGFNLPLSKFAKKNNIKVIYYIAPQLWAWWSSRAKKLQKAVDRLLVILPFEVDFFNKFNINTTFVGNPISDDEDFKSKIFNYKERENLIGVFPGSRKEEITRNLMIIKPIFEQISINFPNFKIGIAVSKNVNFEIYSNFLDNNHLFSSSIVFFDNSRDLMKKAKFGIVKTGTTTLEAGLLGLPYVMFYRASKFNYIIGKNLLNLDVVSLVNILILKSGFPITHFWDSNLIFEKKHLISEYIQYLEPKNIIEEMKFVIDNENNFQLFQNELSKIKQILTDNKASENAAKIIINELSTLNHK